MDGVPSYLRVFVPCARVAKRMAFFSKVVPIPQCLRVEREPASIVERVFHSLTALGSRNLQPEFGKSYVSDPGQHFVCVILAAHPAPRTFHDHLPPCEVDQVVVSRVRVIIGCHGSIPISRSRPPIIAVPRRSEEHTSELQSLMRISYAVFCLKKKKKRKITH